MATKTGVALCPAMIATLCSGFAKHTKKVYKIHSHSTPYPGHYFDAWYVMHFHSLKSESKPEHAHLARLESQGLNNCSLP